MKNKKKKIEDEYIDDIELDERDEEEIRRQLRQKRRRAQTFWDRLAGIIIVTVVIVGCALLGLEYIICKGPSPALRELFVNTMSETRRFRFVPNLMLTEEEVSAIRTKSVTADEIEETDTSLITITAAEAVDENGRDAYGLVDEDGDGVIFQGIKGQGYVGYMLVVLDPNRMFVGMPDAYGGSGLTLEQMVQKYGAKGGINAGGFVDEGGAGNGGMPQGLTIINGVRYGNDLDCVNGLAGFDKDGILYCGYYDYDNCQELGIVNAVSFGPVLIYNGEPVPPESLSTGVNPRTAIGQRADGAVIMLVIDGRQAHSIGATYQDVIDLMLSYGVVNACNMDGGSSTVMHYEGKYVNSCSAEGGVARALPTAFLFK